MDSWHFVCVERTSTYHKLTYIGYMSQFQEELKIYKLVGTHRVRTHAILLLTLTLTSDLSTKK